MITLTSLVPDQSYVASLPEGYILKPNISSKAYHVLEQVCKYMT